MKMRQGKTIGLIASLTFAILIVITFKVYSSSICQCPEPHKELESIRKKKNDPHMDFKNYVIFYKIRDGNNYYCTGTGYSTLQECNDALTDWDRGDLKEVIIIDKCMYLNSLEAAFLLYNMACRGIISLEDPTGPSVSKPKPPATQQPEPPETPKEQEKISGQECNSNYEVKIFSKRYDRSKCTAGSGYKVPLMARVYDDKGNEVSRKLCWRFGMPDTMNDLWDTTGHKLVPTGSQTAEFYAIGNGFGKVEVEAYMEDCTDKKGEKYDIVWDGDIEVGVGGAIICADGKSFCLVLKKTSNIRSGPGTNYKILATLPSGILLNELGRQGDWIKVETFYGLTGWVHKNLVGRVSVKK
jgi:hypothetical protein